MKKIISICLIISLFLSLSLPVCAESKLAQFEQLLVGEWKQVETFDLHDSKSKEYHDFLAIKQFQFPAPANAYTLDNGKYPNDDFVNVFYNAFLTEDATGQIYLAILCLGRFGWTDACIGSISFSKDGNKLIILPIIGDSAGVYERIN